jgi:hypothetical protein
MQFKSLKNLPQIKSIEMNDYARNIVIQELRDGARFQGMTMIHTDELIDDEQSQ